MVHWLVQLVGEVLWSLGAETYHRGECDGMMVKVQEYLCDRISVSTYVVKILEC